MNFKKLFLSLSLMASFGLVACGNDSSSSASENEGSSSSTAPVVLPEANGDSLFTVTGFKLNYTTATQLVIAGSVVVLQDSLHSDTTTVIDSVGFQLANATGNQIVSNFSFAQLTDSTKMLSLGSLSPTLDLTTVTDCGEMKVYLIVYGHNASTSVLTAISEASFTKTCVVEESSSSAEPSADPTLTAWEVTLSTSVTEPNAVDLDSKTTYLGSELVANVATLDLYLSREGSKPILYTNGNLDGAPAASSAIVPETKSLADYVTFPYPTTVSQFAYKGTPSISANDFEQYTSYIVMTSEYDAATGKGFYVVFPHEPQTVGSTITMTLTVLGAW